MCPTRRQQRKTNWWWDMLPLGGDSDVHLSTAPMMGFPPLEGGQVILCWWNVPPLGDCVYTPDGMCLHVKMFTQTCLRAFLGSPIGAETLCCEISPTWSPTLLQRCGPLGVLDLLLMGCAPLRGSCLYTPRWDTPPRESVNTDIPTGLSRKSYQSENLPLWDFSHSESRSAAGMCPLSECSIFTDRICPNSEDHVDI